MNIVIEVNEHYLWIDYGLDGFEVLVCEDAEGQSVNAGSFLADNHDAVMTAMNAELQKIGERKNAAMQDRNAEMNEYARTNGGW
jgi:hypothetical protein